MKKQLLLLACLTLLDCSEPNAIDPVFRSESERRSLDSHWTMIQPGGDTGCSRGTPFHFWTKRGESDNLLVYFLGGGACWSAKSCNKDLPYFEDKPETPPYHTAGIFDLHNPENPFLGASTHPSVHVAHGSGPYTNTRRALTPIDLSYVRGKRVLLKPKAGRIAAAGSGIITHPEVVAAAIDAFQAEP